MKYGLWILYEVVFNEQILFSWYQALTGWCSLTLEYAEMNNFTFLQPSVVRCAHYPIVVSHHSHGQEEFTGLILLV